MKLKKKTKSFLALFMTLVMAMSLLAGVTFAADGDSETGGMTEGEMAGVTGDSASSDAAIYITGNAVTETNDGYTYSSLSEGDTVVIDGLEMTSGDYTYSGVVVTGESSVEIINATVTLNVDELIEGSETAGTAISVDDGSILYITDSTVTVNGAGRYTVACYNDAIMVVTGSTVIAGGDLGADGNTSTVSDPASNAALLVSGTSRANFSIGASHTFYYNSECIAEGWAALSTDSASGTGLELVAYNTYAEATDGGYGTYADSSCRDYLYAVTFNAAELGAIISNNGSITIGSGADAEDATTSDGYSILEYYDGETTDEQSVIYGARNAVQMHSPDMMGQGTAGYQAVLTVSNSVLTTVSTDELDAQSTYDYYDYGDAVGAYVDYITGSVLLVKSTGAVITLDNVEMYSSNGVLIHTIINSDSMSRFLKSEGYDVEVSMTDMDVEGDIVHDDYQRDLYVTLTNTTITGAITTATADSWYAQWEAYVDDDAAYWTTINNDTYITDTHDTGITLEEGSVWYVDDDSNITTLALDDTSSVVVAEGVTLTIEDGDYAGTYTGETIGAEVSADTDEDEGEAEGAATVITGVDDEYTIGVGESITLTPSLGSEAVGGGSDVSTDDLTVSSTSELSAASALTNLASDQNRSQDAGYIYIGVAVVDGEVNTEYSNWPDYYEDGTVTLNDSVSGEGFTAVWASGEGSDVTVTGTIVLDSEGEGGEHASDFTGIGVAVVADSGADVTIEDATIITDGFVRSAAITYSADLTITGTTIVCYGDDPLTEAYDGYYNSASTNMMLSPPWVLGIQGGIRAINVLGDYASVYISDSSITSGGWALISTDGCNYPTIVVADTDMTILPASDEEGMESGYAILGYDADAYGSGYGIYSIGYAHEYFYGVTVSGTTYAAIVRSGDVHYSSSAEYIVYEAGSSSSTDAVEGVTVTGSGANCVISSVFGWLFHSSETASVDLAEGTEVYTENAVFLYKSSATVDITVDDSTLDSAEGVILQMMDDDDNSVGMNTSTMGFNTVFTEDSGIPSTNGDVTGSDGAAVVNVTLTNGDYEGDLYNGTGYYTQGGDNLLVTVGEGATLTGVISATENVHGIAYSEDSIAAIEELSDEITYELLDAEGNVVTDAADAAYIHFTSFTINQYYLLGHMINFNYYNGYNNVMVTVESGSVWTVTGESIITCLVVEEGATVYGTLTDNGDGTYTLTPSDDTVAAGTYGETLSSEGESDGDVKEGGEEILDTDEDTSDEDTSDDTTEDLDSDMGSAGESTLSASYADGVVTLTVGGSEMDEFDYVITDESGTEIATGTISGSGSATADVAGASGTLTITITGTSQGPWYGETQTTTVDVSESTVSAAAAMATTSVWDAYIEYLVEFAKENESTVVAPDITLETLISYIEAFTEDSINDESSDDYITYNNVLVGLAGATTYEDFAASYVVEDEETEEDTSDDTADTEAPDDEDDADTDEENPAEGDEDFDFTYIPEDGAGPGSSGEMTDTEEGDAEEDADADEGGTEEAEPEDGTDEAVFTFASSDESVATVTADGVVTGVAEGTAVITITAVVDGETITKDVTINVTAGAAEEEGDGTTGDTDEETGDTDEETGDTDEEIGGTDEEIGGTDEETGDAGTGDEETGDAGTGSDTGAEEGTEAEGTEEVTEAEETEEVTEAEETEEATEAEETDDESTSAATGDTTDVALWMSLAALALLGLAFVSLKKRFN